MSQLKRVVIHWTAGQYKPNADDLLHYHFLIDGDCNVIKGKFKPEDNIDCKDKKYAAHALGANTGSIGIALCGMLNYESPKSVGLAPIQKSQVEAACRQIAVLCKKYAIPVEEVYTHMEIDKKVKNLKVYDNRKIDIIYLPCFPDIKGFEAVGKLLRSKIAWYLTKL